MPGFAQKVTLVKEKGQIFYDIPAFLASFQGAPGYA